MKTLLRVGERAALAERVNASGGRAVESLENPLAADAIVYGLADWGEPLKKTLLAARKAVRFCDLDLKKGSPADVPACVQSCHALLMSAEEARAMAEEWKIPSAGGRQLIDTLRKGAKLDTVVVTLGEKGAAGCQGERYTLSLGYGKGFSRAGFAAGFIRARMEGWSLDDCLRWGNGFASFGDEALPKDWSERLGAATPVAWSDDFAYWIS